MRSNELRSEAAVRRRTEERRRCASSIPSMWRSRAGRTRSCKMAHCARASLAQDPVYHVPQPRSIPAQRPVIVGFGPAGMFAALVLSMAGLRPLVLERGQDAKARHAAVLRILEDRDARPGVQRAVRRGRRGDVLRREAEHRRQKRAHRLDPRAVCRGGRERRYPLRRQAAHRHGRAGDGRAESARDDHPLRRRGPLRREGSRGS